MANTMAGVENERAVKYGSIRYSAVPATGTAIIPATRATAAQWARAPAKHD
jgi:hypothetical protein